jgi:Glycosyl hydrolase family 79, N-terminal domain
VQRLSGVAIVVASITTLSLHVHAQEPAMKIGPPEKMRRVGSIEERYQSYNIEMLEVTGGMFWKPYSPASSERPAGALERSGVPAGMDADLYEYRPPVDLSNGKIRKLAAALGPAYVRVSGTWANTMYFADSDPAPSSPPSGFNGVMSRERWKGVVDSAGVWMPGQARGFLDYTRSVGGDIAAAEFMNEPTMATMGGAPKGYDAEAFGRDFKLFASLARQAASGMRVLGPGSVGETTAPDAMIHYGSQGVIATRDMLQQMGTDIDAFSYHHYGAASQRCAGTAGMPQTSAGAALSEEWLARTDQTLAFYRNLRDEFDPGKRMWLTETADAACGGNPWASTFLDTFRYLDQLGRLAKQGVQVVIHNTLAASDYGLLDQQTLKPRPNYWGALLWRRLMGTTVLDSGVEIAEGRHVYAHCLMGSSGGVTLLVINNSRTETAIEVPLESRRYTLSAVPLQNGDVELNGAALKVDSSGNLPPIEGAAIAAGSVSFAPVTITFLTVEQSGNSTCRGS